MMVLLLSPFYRTAEAQRVWTDHPESRSKRGSHNEDATGLAQDTRTLVSCLCVSQSTFHNTFITILVISPGDMKVVLLFTWVNWGGEAWGRVDQGHIPGSGDIISTPGSHGKPPTPISHLCLSGGFVFVLPRNILSKWKLKISLDQKNEGWSVPVEAGRLHIPPALPIPIPPPRPQDSSVEHNWEFTASSRVTFQKVQNGFVRPWKDWVVIGEMSMERPEIPGNRKKSIEEKQVFIWVSQGLNLAPMSFSPRFICKMGVRIDASHWALLVGQVTKHSFI